MHWADEVANDLIAKHPDAEVFTCASGISPSGPVHIGNFREVITTYFVVKALRDLGKKVRFIYSWDSYDRLRKVSSILPADYTQYIGMPYSEIPDPFKQNKNFEAAFEKPMMDAVKEMGIDAEFIFQSDEYKSGRYAKNIIISVVGELTTLVCGIFSKTIGKSADFAKKESFFLVIPTNFIENLLQ